MMIQCKAKPEPDKQNRRSDTNRSGDWGGRGDTWTDRSEPLYDRNGNQVGTFNNPNRGWENDRR